MLESLNVKQLQIYDNHYVRKIQLLFSDRDKKRCGKMRKCWLPVFSPFTTMFSKDIFFHGRENQELLNMTATERFENILVIAKINICKFGINPYPI